MQSKASDVAGITMALSNLTLSGITGAATTYTSVAADFAINGKVTTLGTQSTAAFPTADAATATTLAGLTAANTGTVVVVGVKNGGTALIAAQGSVEKLDAAGNFIAGNLPKFPPLPDDFCPGAYIVMKAGSTFVAASFHPGTDNWNTTGMSYAVQNVCALPDRPQAA